MKILAKVILLAGMLLILFAAFPTLIQAGEPFTSSERPKITPSPARSTAGVGLGAVETISPVESVPYFDAIPQPTRAPGTPESGISLDLLSISGNQDPVIARQVPIRIAIPAIDLDAPVKPATLKKVLFEGDVFEQWTAPKEFAAGWHTTTALLGEVGNTVLSGHHNEFGEVFRNLVNLQVRDRIVIYAGEKVYQYEITNKMILPELNESRQKRLENAGWISKSDDERLTLVTCWPYESNTHRLIIVARPVN